MPGHVVRRKARVSGMAVTALALAVIPCCPMVSALGALLGILALRRIQASGGTQSGAGIAKAAVAIGIGIAILSAVMYGSFMNLVNGTNQDIMVHLVEDAIRQSAERDFAGAEKLWTDDARNAMTADQVHDFGTQTHERYGLLKRFTVTSSELTGSIFEREFVVAGIFVFESRDLTGSAQFRVSANGSTLWPEFKLESLAIADPEGGELRLPAAAAKP